MAGRIVQFLQDYDDLAASVEGANRSLFATNLARWFSLIDEEQGFAPEVAKLESLIDFDAWYQELRVRQRSQGLGSAPLNFPADRDATLGVQIALFRRIARGEIDPAVFGFEFISPGERNINACVRNLSEQLFVPTARAVRRRLERVSFRPESPKLDELLVPASDRVVDIDHNSAAYTDAVSALEKAEAAVQQANDYDDIEDREQRVAEISAGRRLLGSARARTEALVAVIYRCLSYLVKKFADTAVGLLAAAALAAVGKLIGLW